jgi:hypothetical protein
MCLLAEGGLYIHRYSCEIKEPRRLRGRYIDATNPFPRMCRAEFLSSSQGNEHGNREDRAQCSGWQTDSNLAMYARIPYPYSYPTH